jgi:chromosome segregation ATPase
MMLRRFLALLLLFSFCASSLLALDITIPIEDYQTIRGQLMLLRNNLTQRETELRILQQDSQKQSKEILDLLKESENLNALIASLLNQSEISEAEYQETLTYWEKLSKDLNNTVKRLEFENKVLKIGGSILIVLSFIGGVKVGFSINN